MDASRRYCWWSWEEQIRSLAKLIPLKFTWVLPGHGERVHQAPELMQSQLRELVQRKR